MCVSIFVISMGWKDRDGREVSGVDKGNEMRCLGDVLGL